MVREIKGKNENPYEKSRLVIAVIAACLQNSVKLKLRDITQVYLQSRTVVQRYILAQLPPQLQQKFLPDTTLHVIKPLYGVAESGVHWFTTYQKHHIEKLNMVTSTYDPCLLITKSDSIDSRFGIVGMQTDDTLIVANSEFSAKEQEKIEKAKFDTKAKQTLSSDMPLNFNGYTVAIDSSIGSIKMYQKGQGL
ncbi:hypothetical protein EV44_g4253 [Erysiphe necator]|uniref:Reverse transcriptase Ty1/copia-type domain-containing protein n=1 Tax=Uncinula necator TaxID=52586 RepID=A0A0B1PCF6_UNCNE|nr:hypothetical protein EV44_g4253 [Erysiphe necator]